MSTCLICHSTLKDNCDDKQTCVQVESQIRVVFVLQKLLNVTTSHCVGYLEKFGNPSNWIKLCDNCNSLVGEAYSLHKRIQELEHEFSAIRDKLHGGIKESESSIRKGHSKSSSHINVIQDELRNWICNDESRNLYEPGTTGDGEDMCIKVEPFDDEEDGMIDKSEAYHHDPADGDYGDVGPSEEEDRKSSVSSTSYSNRGRPLRKRIRRNFVALSDSDNDDDNNNEQDSDSGGSSLSGSWILSRRRKKSAGHPRKGQSQQMVSSEHDEMLPDGTLQCKICQKVYTKKKSLRSHQNIAHNLFFRTMKKPTTDYEEAGSDGSLTCKLCNKTYSKRNSLRKHQNLAHKLFFKKSGNAPGRFKEIEIEPQTDKVFSCSTCNKTFSTKVKLTRHIKGVHVNKGKEQKVRKVVKIASAKTREGLADVEVDETPINETCVHCNLRFSTVSGFTNHKLALHREEMETAESSNSTKVKKVDYLRLIKDMDLIPWKCSNCLRWFSKQEERDNHQSAVHRASKIDWSKGSHKCIQCETNYTTKSDLRLHVELDHDGESLPDIYPLKISTCQQCPCKFVDESRLEFHYGKVHGIVKNPSKTMVGGICPVCGLACHSHNYFRLHMQAHSGQRFYLCELCSSSFTFKRYLDMHMVKDHGETSAKMNPFGCEKCDRIFSTKAYLRLHINTVHEKNYRFICAVCGARRESASSLRQHMLSHGDGKLYKCPHCDESYRTNNSLSFHISAKHSGIKFACQFCGKEFSARQDCSRHEQAIHIKANKFKCEFCSKEFPIRDYYRSHLKRCEKNSANSAT